MIEVVDKRDVKEEAFELEIGDILLTDEGKLWSVCDGRGQSYFINLENGLILSESRNKPFKIDYYSTLHLGQKLIVDECQSYEIKGMVKSDNVKAAIVLQ